MRTWLLLDANYLCRRAFHSMPGLSYHDIPTGVIYGLLRDVSNLQDLHATDDVVFCFDHGQSRRVEAYPAYKAHRRPGAYTHDERVQNLNIFRAQVELIRKDYLRQIGYRNVFSQFGYEADDLIGSLCQKRSNGDDVIIVSEDQDFYQLLTPHVSIYHPKKNLAVTRISFVKSYRISPEQWITVKAIAGCHTDNIMGVPRVGEATALKYVKGTLSKHLSSYDKIESQREMWEENIKLVSLPYPGVEPMELRDNEVTVRKWKAFCERYGMTSIANRPPISGRQTRQRVACGETADD